MKMSVETFGWVLVKMAGYARDRADLRRDFLGPHNTELLWALSHMLAAGAQACQDAAEGDVPDPR